MSGPATPVTLVPADRATLGELAPLLRRVVDLDRRAIVRLRLGAGHATGFARLPFGVLVSRAVSAPGESARPVRDVTVSAGEALSWLDDAAAAVPAQRDAEWRGGLPPAKGWRRVESVPDQVVRELVRSGALALKQAAEREGVPGAQPRSEVTDTLLDSVVLTLRADDADARQPGSAHAAGPAGAGTAEVTLRALSALTRMGFVPRDSVVHVDVAGRWTRVVGGYGTVHTERGTSLLALPVR